MTYYFRDPVNPAIAMTAVFKSIEEMPRLCGRVRCSGRSLSSGFRLEPAKRDSNFSDFSTLMMAARTKPLLAYDLARLGQDHWATVLDVAKALSEDATGTSALMTTDVFVGDEDEDGSTGNWIYYVFLSFETGEAADAFRGKFENRDIDV